jgi:hypothetical protein
MPTRAVSLALAEPPACTRRCKLLSFPNPSKVLPFGGALLLTACSAGYVVLDKDNNVAAPYGTSTGKNDLGKTVVPIITPPGSGPLFITLKRNYRISQGQWVTQWVSGMPNPYDHSKDRFTAGGIVVAIISHGVNKEGGHDYILKLSTQTHWFGLEGGVTHFEMRNQDVLVSDNLNNQLNHVRVSFVHEEEADLDREIYREAYAKEGRVPPWEETPASAGRN